MRSHALVPLFVVAATIAAAPALAGLIVKPAGTGQTARAGVDQTAAGPSARPLGDAALLPPDGALGPWKKIGDPRVFARADLYGYIDGGAELFFEFGFQQLTQQKYQAGANQIVVDFYRMRDPIAATGVYLMKCGNETPAPALADWNTINRYQLMFVRDRFFVIVNNVTGAAAVAPDMEKLASVVASKLPASRPLAELTRLPPSGLVKGSVRLIRGPYGFQAIFTLGEGDILLLDGQITAIAADYADPARGSWTCVEVNYPTATAAASAMANLQARLDSYLTTLSKTPNRLVFRDYEKKFGEATLQGQRLSLTLHLRKQPQ